MGLNLRQVILSLLGLCSVTSGDYYYRAGQNVQEGDIYMSDGDNLYDQHWPMDSSYPGQAAGAGTSMHNAPKCMDIPSNLTLCQNLRYQQMRLPNLLEHDTIREVTQQAGSWVPLVGIRCHPDTKLFLCSLFSPVCLDRPIWPCRSLCFAVKGACEGHMNAHGYSWPDMLRCDKFPLDNDLCIGLQNEPKPDEKSCEPCTRPDTYESIIHHYCISDFVVKMRIEENVIVDGMARLTGSNKKKKIHKPGVWTRTQLRRPVVYLQNGGDCECNILEDPQNLQASYLVMGKVENGKHMINYMQIYDRRSKDLRKAFRKIRQGHVCEDGVKALTIDDTKAEEKVENKEPPKNSKNSDNDKKRKRRRERGGNGKRDSSKRDSNKRESTKRNRKSSNRNGDGNSQRRNKNSARTQTV